MDNYTQGIYPIMNYIKGGENITSDALSRLPNNRNQQTAHELNKKMKTMSELYDIKELSKGLFPIIFDIIIIYQQKYPSLPETLTREKYKRGSFVKDKILLIL